MKECPDCKKLFTDDLYYCLYDGVALIQHGQSVDPSAPTEPTYKVGSSDPTQVLPRPVPPTQKISNLEQPASSSPSKLLYVVIGALAAICAVLAVALIAVNFDHIFPSRENKNEPVNDAKATPTPSPVAASPSPTPNTVRSVNQTVGQPPIAYNPTGRWKGDWSTVSGTLLDFELNLTETGNNNLDGQIKWTLRKTARPDKADKIGLTAIEYVRGKYDPSTGLVNMSGYSKDDPNGVLVMLDVYKLNISSDGHTLSGLARNGGKWNGHVKLNR